MCDYVREGELCGFCADLYHSVGWKAQCRVIVLWEPLRTSCSVIDMSQLEVLAVVWSLYNKTGSFPIRSIRSEPACRSAWCKFSSVRYQHWWKDGPLTNQFPGKYSLNLGATVYFLKGVLCKRLPFSHPYLFFSLFFFPSIAHLK